MGTGPSGTHHSITPAPQAPSFPSVPRAPPGGGEAELQVEPRGGGIVHVHVEERAVAPFIAQAAQRLDDERRADAAPAPVRANAGLDDEVVPADEESDRLAAAGGEEGEVGRVPDAPPDRRL